MGTIYESASGLPQLDPTRPPPEFEGTGTPTQPTRRLPTDKFLQNPFPRMIKITNGLDLPLAGEPKQTIEEGRPPGTVAVVGPDYIGMKPSMAVSEGDRVKKGQLLFEDKKTPGVKYTAPAAGRVAAINRGAKRVFQSLVIEVDGEEEQEFASHDRSDLTALDRDQVRENLVESGLWTALRTRPFSKVPPRTPCRIRFSSRRWIPPRMLPIRRQFSPNTSSPLSTDCR